MRHGLAPSLLAFAALSAEDAAPPAPADRGEDILVSGSPDEAFSTGRDGSADKLDLPWQQAPQSSTALDRDLLDARAAWTLREALRSAPGVTMAAGEGGRTGDSLNIRGFAANSDMYLDGLKDNGQYFRDTFATESVEVLRGASAVLFGRGATGGAVNVVTRKPTEEWTGSGALTAGGYGFLRATAGAGGPVGGPVGVRLDAMAQTGGSFRDESRLDRTGVAGAVAVQAGERTRILVQAIHTREASNMDYGVPMYRGRPADVPISTYYGFKDDSFQEYQATVGTLTVEHRFSDHVALRNTTRSAAYDRRYRTEILGAVNYATDQVAVTQALRDNRQTNLVNQTELSADGRIRDREVRLVAGLELAREGYAFRSRNSGSIAPIDVFDPDQPDTTGSVRADDLDGTLNSRTSTATRSLAVYALASVEILPRLQAVAGGRFDRFLADYTSGPTTSPAVSRFSRGDSVVSPRGGLVWTPVSSVSVYASYSTAFNPSAETFSLSTATADLDPEETRNLEAGVKTGLLDGALSLGVAVFRLEKINARTTDPSNSTLQVLDGRQRTDGIEAEATGHLGRRWTVQGGVALFDPRVTRSNTTASTWDGRTVEVEGKRPVNTPTSSGSLWLTCDLGGGLSTAAGFYATARRYADQANSVVLPGYVRFDANLAYVTRLAGADWRTQLNVLNLFDTVHYEAGSARSAYPGTPLAAQLTLSAAF